MLHVLSRGRYFCPHEGESVRAQSQLNSFSQAENLTFLDLIQVSFGGPANHGEVTNYSCRAAARCRLATPSVRFPLKSAARAEFSDIVPTVRHIAPSGTDPASHRTVGPSDQHPVWERDAPLTAAVCCTLEMSGRAASV